MITQISQQPNKSQEANHNQIDNSQAIDSTKMRVKKCEQIAQMIQQKIQTEIKNGEIKIKDKPLHIQNQRISENPERSLRDKINSLSTDLESLYKHIEMQKEENRLKEEAKRRQASVLIERLKRQKQQFRNKIKANEMNNRLKNSAISQDVLKLMRERRDSLIEEKKKDMESRIEKNVNRKVEREQQRFNKQILYWSKVKELEGKRRHQSTKILPSINKNFSQPFGPSAIPIQRKNSLNGNLNIVHKRSLSKQDGNRDYLSIVNKFLERAMAKKVVTENYKTPEKKKDRAESSSGVYQKNQFQLQNSRVSYAPVSKESAQKLAVAFLQNRHKILGDEYLKQSLLRIKDQQTRKSMASEVVVDESIFQIKGNKVEIGKNELILKLEKRRKRIYEKLSSLKIDKQKAIQMLHPIEQKLDKISPEQMEERLRQKLEAFRLYGMELDRRKSILSKYPQSQETQQLL